jgi:hypothetical protein
MGSWGTAVGSEDGIDEENLCVVCWVGHRSVALVHGNDAHLVSSLYQVQLFMLTEQQLDVYCDADVEAVLQTACQLHVTDPI